MSFELHNVDCLEFMRSMPDKSVDAVITDPPYGIGADVEQAEKNGTFGRRIYEHKTNWDTERPSKEFFCEILRVSKRQIIFGGNYFADMLPPSMGWLGWDKAKDNFSMSEFELAWTSENRATRFIRKNSGNENKTREHPTQKPLAVIAWCITWLDRKKDIQTIFDPFMGSGTTGAACMQLGRNFIGCEIDPNYYAIAERRIKKAAMQEVMFT